MKLTEDDKGLRMEVTPIDNNAYREVVRDIDTEMIIGQSFGFTVKKDEWDNLDGPGLPIRTILEFERIWDVSVVTIPAYPDTTVALRGMENARAQHINRLRRYKLRINRNLAR